MSWDIAVYREIAVYWEIAVSLGDSCVLGR